MPLTATTASAWTPTARTGYAAPSSLAASRREWTSAVGFFWLASRDSLWRVTQTTPIFFFRHRAPAWEDDPPPLTPPPLPPLPRPRPVERGGAGLLGRTP